MLRSSGMRSLTRCCVLLSLVVPTVLGASCQGKDSSSGGIAVLPLSRRDTIGVAIGVDHSANRTYSIGVTVGQSSLSLAIATDLGDFVAVSTGCQTPSCKHFNGTLYDAGASFLAFGYNTTVPLFYYGTAASSHIGEDSVIIGGLNVPDQNLAVISSFNRTDLFNGTAGIFGLGFPLTSDVAIVGASGFYSSGSGQLSSVFADTSALAALGSDRTASSDDVAQFLALLYAHGPIVTTVLTYGDINEPLFSLTFDPKVSVSGNTGSGQLTIGSLPTGVDNSSLTWVPVQLYDIAGLNGTVPLHWEVEIDAVFLNSQALPGSSKVTAVVDSTATNTGGPKDAIDAILDTIATTTPACNGSHTLSFQIGGELFPIAPQDLVTQTGRGQCAVNVEAIDSLSSNTSLYSWRLGAAFLRSNMVAFHYGNLTYPSVEPPRMGFRRSSDARSTRLSGVEIVRCGWLALVSVWIGMLSIW